MISQTLPYSVSLGLALNGEGAPSRALYDAALREAHAALGALARTEPELFTILDRTDDLRAAEAVAESFHDASTVAVFGIGGSSLGARVLSDLLPGRGLRPARVIIADNPDPASFEDLLGGCDLRTTRFVAISKSGGTAETLMQTLAAAAALQTAGLDPRAHFAVVTEPRDSALRRFALERSIPTLDHPTGIGGRYSVLTVVGLLPAILMGLDARAVRAGARAVLSDALTAGDPASVPAVAGAALHSALARSGRLRETVLWPYADRLCTFGAWWRQLWAESLGKNGQGSTPVAALGPVDQHSQLQLFLDGPGGALFTLVSTQTAGQGPVAPAADAERLGISYLAGRRMGDLVDAELRATAETLARRGRPVRRIDVPVVDERALGALFMHFMLETILMGRLMGVDPFDQPAVEEGKVLARAYLEGRKA